MSSLSPVRPAEKIPLNQQIQADRLIVYPEVQRLAPSKDSIKKIADELDYSKLGTLTVNHRTDLTYSLLDGQRRVAALKSRGLGSHLCKCLVYQGLSVEQEADMFLGLNSVRVVSSTDRFFVGLTAGRPECLGVVDSLRRVKWEMSRSRSTRVGFASCTEAMIAVWKHDKNGALLDRVLVILDEAFGRDKNTMNGHLVAGLAKMLKQGDFDNKELIEKLRAKFPSPISVITMARGRAETEGGTLQANVAHVIGRVFESRKRRV